MKKSVFIFSIILLSGLSINNACAFSCTTASGTSIGIGGGEASVYIPLSPTVGVGENLVVDLSSQIRCRNTTNKKTIDYVSLQSGSTFSGLLENFTGTVSYNGASYPLPTKTETATITYRKSATETGWPVLLYLTPVNAAGGVVITAGDKIASLVLHQTNNYGDSNEYVWNIYASNDTIVPTGGCDVSARNVAVELPVYPGTKRVPLTVACKQNQKLSYYLSGTTVDSANSVFSNSATDSAAQGIGVQLRHNGVALPANTNVSLGTVGASSVDLGLTATYALTGGSLTSGNVTSLIGVTFIYD